MELGWEMPILSTVRARAAALAWTEQARDLLDRMRALTGQCPIQDQGQPSCSPLCQSVAASTACSRPEEGTGKVKAEQPKGSAVSEGAAEADPDLSAHEAMSPPRPGEDGILCPTRPLCSGSDTHPDLTDPDLAAHEDISVEHNPSIEHVEGFAESSLQSRGLSTSGFLQHSGKVSTREQPSLDEADSLLDQAQGLNVDAGLQAELAAWVARAADWEAEVAKLLQLPYPRPSGMLAIPRLLVTFHCISVTPLGTSMFRGNLGCPRALPQCPNCCPKPDLGRWMRRGW